ncbi:MAG: ribonuclease III [Clostridiales bacterium]|nr:MAG: ribonuclease III [Clostridiales bacterium]
MGSRSDGGPRGTEFLEKAIGYAFCHREYLYEALRHSSWVNENKQYGLRSNERLEFLGDSVLSVVASGFLFDCFSDHPEGDLTKIRADIVCTRSLSGFAKAIDLGDYLYLGNGQEERGGRGQDKILEDAFEALVAAIYLDSGKDLEKVKEFLLPLIRREIEKILSEHPIIDPKSHLQEIVQEARGMLEYEIVSESGPDHDKRYICEVRIDHNVMGRGEGTSKKKAEIAAAEDALRTYIVE